MRFFSGFILASLCFFIAGFVGQNRSDYGTIESLNSEFRNIFNNVQSINFRVENSSPTVKDLRDGEIIRVKTGDLKIVTRNGNTLYYMNLKEF